MQPSTRKPPGWQHVDWGGAGSWDKSSLALYLFHQLLLLLQAMAGDVSVSGSRFMLHFCYGSSLLAISSHGGKWTRVVLLQRR